jgi:hypothetical protein
VILTVKTDKLKFNNRKGAVTLSAKCKEQKGIINHEAHQEHKEQLL